MNISVVICTYKREFLLQACIASVLESIKKFRYDSVVEIIVVDNDPLKSAEQSISRIAATVDLKIIYISEPKKSLSKVRNTALESSKSDLLCFIDDDEVCCEEWLNELVDVYLSNQCQVVLGPVIPIYPENTHLYFIKSRFFERKRFNNGEVVTKGGIGNSLLDLNFIRKNRIVFDESFGLSGGEDTKFFSDILKINGIMRWANYAECSEKVSENRLSYKYIFVRSFRGGQTHCKIRVLPKGLKCLIGNIFIRTLELLLCAFILLPAFLFYRPIFIKILSRLAAAFGQISAPFAKNIEMY